MTKFARALQTATLQDIGDGMTLLTVSLGSYFPDDPHKRRNQLLVRDFYPILFQRMSSEPTGQLLLTGVPGTGKSWWIWYAIHVLLNRDDACAIVWQSFKRGGDKCVLFKDGKAIKGPLAAFDEELSQPSTW